MSGVLSLFNDDEPKLRASELLGRQGESLASDHLVQSGYRIVVTNFKVPVGRNRQGAQISGEIDIIAFDCEALCFVEVKARRSEEFTPAITAVDVRKQRQITRTARIYRRIFGITDTTYRFDVVTVIVSPYAPPHIELIKSFWNESKFSKRIWHYPSWENF